MKADSNELNLFEIDWTSIPENIKNEILREHIHCVSLSRRAVGATGAYVANMRSLIMMLFLSLALVLQGAENRTIVLTIVSLQFAKTFFSRLFEANLLTALEIAKKDFIQFLKRKSLS